MNPKLAVYTQTWNSAARKLITHKHGNPRPNPATNINHGPVPEGPSLLQKVLREPAVDPHLTVYTQTWNSAA